MSPSEHPVETPSLSAAKRRLLEKWLAGQLRERPEAPAPIIPPHAGVNGHRDATSIPVSNKMLLQVTPYRPEHFDALQRFVARVGLRLSLAHAPFVNYYYAEQDWCRLYLAIGPDERIVATYGLEIARFEYNHNPITMGLSSNFYSIQAGAGLFLFGCASQWCPVRLIFGGTTDTQKMFRDLKWKYYEGMRIYVLNRSYDAYPGDSWVRVAGKSLAQRLARRRLSHFASRLPFEVCGQVSVREQQSFSEDLLPVRSPFTFRFAPSLDYLTWRYNPSLPFVRYRLFRILNNEQTAGYVVINERPDKIIVAHCDGTDARILAYGVLRAIMEVGRADRLPRSVILASCHRTMQEIYLRFGFRPEPEPRPFYIGTVDGSVQIDGDTSNWLVNFDWGDNGLRAPFLDQHETVESTHPSKLYSPSSPATQHV
jgi:hypothetical protein